MGRKASHVALECTLQSHPNMVSFSYLVLCNLIMPLWSYQHIFYIFLDLFSKYNWICSCRLFLGRRWLPQSLHFLILQHKFVMQFKLGQSKVLNNSSFFMLLVIISVFVIWPISFFPHFILGTRQVSWSHLTTRRSYRKHPWNICPIEGNRQFELIIPVIATLSLSPHPLLRWIILNHHFIPVASVSMENWCCNFLFIVSCETNELYYFML